jgi:hypothetical protein
MIHKRQLIYLECWQIVGVLKKTCAQGAKIVLGRVCGNSVVPRGAI